MNIMCYYLLFLAYVDQLLRVLNQACARHRLACAWFLKIASVRECLYVCVCVCLCVRP